MWALSATSSAKRSSGFVIIFRFYFALIHARLKRWPSVLEWSLTPVVDEPKACFDSIEKKTPKTVWASTQPCLVYTFDFKWARNTTIILDGYPFVCMKKLQTLNIFGGHPIFSCIENSPSLLTKLKALVRAIKAMCNSILCLLNLLCVCRREKIILVVNSLDLNPHWDSGYTHLASCWSQGRTTFAKALPAFARR